MTASSDHTAKSPEYDLVSALEGDSELRASLAAIAERIHENPEDSQSTVISDWQQWLEDEGYDTSALRTWIASLLSSEGIPEPVRSIGSHVTSGELISILQIEEPDLLDTVLQSIDHSLKIHQDLFGVAGGTGHPPIAQALKLERNRIAVDKRQLAVKEAAGESAVSFTKDSNSNNQLNSEKSKGLGNQREFDRAIREAATDPIKYGRNESERKVAFQPVDGRNGAGEEREYARAIDAVRDLLERRDTILGPGGEQDRLSRVVDDLRQAIESRRDNIISEQGRLSRAVDAVREAMDRRNTIVGPGGEQDVRLDRALDDLKRAVDVALDPNPAARRAELRRAPALSDRQERQLDHEIQPVDGRNGAGEEREYARAIDAVRDLLERRDTIVGPGGEQDRLSRVVDDLRQAIESRRENFISEQGRLSRAVDAVREAMDRRNTIVGPGGEQDVRLDRALDALRDQLYLPNIGVYNSAGKEPRLLSMDMRDFEFDQKDLELQKEIDRLTIPKDLNDQLSDALKNLKATTEMMLLGKMEPIDVNGAVRVVRDSLEAATKYVGIDDSERLADRVDELEATIADIAETATAIKKTQNLALNLKMEIDIKRLEKDLGALELTANVKSAIDTSLKSSLENLERFMVDGADSSERDMLEKLDASLKETRATIEESKELMSLADHARVIDQIKRLGERVEFRKERMGELISVEAMDARMAMKLLDVRRGLSDMIANTAEARDLDRLERLRFDVNEALRSFNEPMIKEARPPMDASKARLANEELAVAEICVASIGLAQEAKKANIREEDRMAFEAVANMPKRMIEDTQEDIEATLNDLTDRISPYDDGGYIPEYKEVEDRTNLADKIEPYNATGRLTLQDRLNELTRAYRNYRDVAGRNGVGEEKEYARILDSLRSPDTAPRAEFQETKPGMMGATSRSSEARYVPLVDSLRNLESDLESEVELNQEVRNTGQQDSPLNKAMKQTLDCMDNARL